MRNPFLGISPEVEQAIEDHRQQEQERQLKLAADRDSRALQAEQDRVLRENQEAADREAAAQRALQLAARREAAAESLPAFVGLFQRAQEIIDDVGAAKKTGLIFEERKWLHSNPVIVLEEDGVEQQVELVLGTEKTGFLKHEPMALCHTTTFIDHDTQGDTWRTQPRSNGLWYDRDDGTFDLDPHQLEEKIAAYEGLLSAIEDRIR